MTEHPNYKYRPRRRKQNKARPNQPGSATQPTVPTATLGSPYAADSPDTRFQHNPSASFSPYRSSPLASDSYTSQQYNGHAQTPESSPARSPEPQGRRSASADAPLPTPDASPVENEKENFQYGDDRRRQVATESYSPYKAYRGQGSYSPAPVAAMGMANGMYVMCTQRSQPEQAPLVTGTFFPPVATSQDQQTLGTSAPRVSSAPSSQMANEYNLQYYEQYEPMYKTEEPYPGHYPEQPKTEYDNSGAYFAEEPPGNSEQEQGFMAPRQELRPGSPESDVDAREFDKYLEYGTEGGLEQPHYRYDAPPQQFRSPYCEQPAPDYCPERMYAPPYASVLATGPPPPGPFVAAPPGADVRPEDEFSVILAGVRQTCYSN